MRTSNSLFPPVADHLSDFLLGFVVRHCAQVVIQRGKLRNGLADRAGLGARGVDIQQIHARSVDHRDPALGIQPDHTGGHARLSMLSMNTPA